MKKIRLVIVGLSYSRSPSGAYTIVLSDSDGKRTLPIIIGGTEAQAIAMELEHITPYRPLTHDLFRNFAQTFDIHVREIFIFHLENGIFHSQIVCQQNGQDYYLDARTSDAIAIGVRFKAPIFINEDILESAGILLEEELDMITKQTSDSQDPPPFTLLNETNSTQELQIKLQEAIKNEEYELASILRDEIKKRTMH